MDDVVTLGDILFALFVTPRNLIIIGSAWALALVVGLMLPKRWVRGYKAHVTPAVYLAFCSSAVWVSGLRPGLPKGRTEIARGTGISGEEIGYRIGLGIILAFACVVVPVALRWAAKKWLPPNVAKSLERIL